MLVHAIDCDLNILYILSRHARIYLDIILHFMHANFIYAIEVTTGLVKKT